MRWWQGRVSDARKCERLGRMRIWLSIPRNLLVALFGTALLLRLGGIFYPQQVVFDEVHFGKFANAYVATHQRFFDVHPPHAKLLIAFGAATLGYSGTQSFEKIGDPFTPNDRAIALRVVPALAGSLMVVAFVGWLFQLGFPIGAAALAGWAVAWDNAFVVQSRVAVLDSILLAGIMVSLWASFDAWRQSRSLRRDLAAAAVAGAAAGIAVGSKFIGCVAPGMAGCLYAVLVWRDRRGWLFVGRAVVMILSFLCVYLGGWCLHFGLLTEPGSGDAFFKLSGDFWPDLATYHRNMLRLNLGLDKGHIFSSLPLSWPAMFRPIYYWVSDSAHFLFFVGNPVVWFGALLGQVLWLVGVCRYVGRWRPTWESDFAWPSLLYVASFGPFWSFKRVVFLYHYLTPLLGSIAIAARALESSKARRFVPWIYALIVVGFAFASPYTYGIPPVAWFHDLLHDYLFSTRSL